VLDGVVVSAPRFNEPILGGQAQIEGNFTAQEANDLANVLKYGALPVTLDPVDITSVSPTVGNDQLRAGIIAGLLGLVLVMIYLMIYYRALGIVAVISLIMAGAVTYLMIVVFSKTIGLTLTLAGVAGAIVAIGITADSFIVYFERIRDEIREGRSLRQACESGWVRARRTLLAADFVSLLAAAVLYLLSVGSVRGFAFILGLTTIVDILVAFWFTHPLVVLIGRTGWMQKGSRWTGLDADRVGGHALTGEVVSKSRRRQNTDQETVEVPSP
jgi:preprotein translocase subunit SecD